MLTGSETGAHVPSWATDASVMSSSVGVSAAIICVTEDVSPQPLTACAERSKSWCRTLILRPAATSSDHNHRFD